MLKYLFLIFLGVIYTQNSKASFELFQDAKAGLDRASNYEDFLENTVNPIVTEIKRSYEVFPNEVCLHLQEMPITDLINYREVLVQTEESLPCSKVALDRIDSYYSGFKVLSLKMASYATIFPMPESSPLKSIEIVLDKQYRMPFQNSLPKGVINLTFDDGPSPKYTPKILKILNDYKVKANFFVLGSNAKSHPETLKVEASEGHSIGAHSMDHKNLKAVSFAYASKDILNVFDVIESILGSVQPFFRFPYGNKTSALAQFLKENNISEFFWNMDSLDWKFRKPSVLLPYVIQHTKNVGHGIMLFHDIHPQTVAVLPAYLEFLENNGYKTVYYTSSLVNGFTPTGGQVHLGR
jgi:peptidoglycan/xylan/chitin deacetylase (PgdA/CDA1 family)